MPSLAPEEWLPLAAAHERRVDAWVQPHLVRRRRGEKHPVEDFLFDYYHYSPARLRRWSPGLGTALLGREAIARYADLSDRNRIPDRRPVMLNDHGADRDAPQAVQLRQVRCRLGEAQPIERRASSPPAERDAAWNGPASAPGSFAESPPALAGLVRRRKPHPVRRDRRPAAWAWTTGCGPICAAAPFSWLEQSNSPPRRPQRVMIESQHPLGRSR